MTDLKNSTIDELYAVKPTSYNLPWELKEVSDVQWIGDASGVYVLISWRPITKDVRLDVMSDNHDPVVSFAGSAGDVRKAAMQWLGDYNLSIEHAAYIGQELERAAWCEAVYVQE